MMTQAWVPDSGGQPVKASRPVGQGGQEGAGVWTLLDGWVPGPTTSDLYPTLNVSRPQAGPSQAGRDPQAKAQGPILRLTGSLSYRPSAPALAGPPNPCIHPRAWEP